MVFNPTGFGYIGKVISKLLSSAWIGLGDLKSYF
jgi:hypothetical protein